MPSSFQSKLSFVLAIILGVVLYVCGSFVTLMLVQSLSEPKSPMQQHVFDVKTVRYSSMTTELRYRVNVTSDSALPVNILRRIRNVETEDIYLMPNLQIMVQPGVREMNIVMELPKNMPTGVYEYHREFVFYPSFSLMAKSVKVPVIEFQICNNSGPCIEPPH